MARIPVQHIRRQATPDLIVPRIWSEGQVSEDAQRIGDQIHEVIVEQGAEAGIALMEGVFERIRELHKRGYPL